MSASDNLPPLPDEAKAIAPFIQRAREMAPRDPAIAYWCKMHAVRQALQLASTLPQIKPWLLAAMDALEAEKKTVPTRASMRTAKTFLAACNYFEVLSVFPSPLDDATLDKIKYAKWKATDIVKALRAGERPRPGPPVADEDTQTSAEGAAAPPELPSVPSFAAPQQQPPSPFQQQPPTTGFYQQQPPSAGYQQQPPAAPHAASGYPSYAQQPPPASPYQHAAPSSSAWPSAPPAPAPAPAPVPAQTTGGSAPSGTYALAYDPAILSRAQKHARYVISALEYDDVATAVDHLRQALAALAPYTTN
ncbi:hypothetical protein AMAG_11887 [Allomyces macrogynus ATCC 38327]|uniref:Vta1/callose synthase N-terminal domain-containing protein n=1 Tax=Allomyces macrogynus (strain ATCC 38327) TaxID=578462 RepID=A0A0L0SY44_ALLM3|nr:hypothetical protein AMAG_11887 [Allomyces macrogynus ATCC 38327]|eukprot:KNE67426.1 hypothetical protein AMAG_11887 [Allomyces macrogynus ATCC 38327]